MISTNMAALLRIASRPKVGNFKITFLTGTFPASITLGTAYAGPATASAALYDPGDGTWNEYTSKTITLAGDYVAFKGDWRTAAGTYQAMFYGTLASDTYTCKFSGAFAEAADTVENCYRDVFRINTALSPVVAIEDNPLPNLTGAPAIRMYFATYYNLANVTGDMPVGFMDLSGLAGAPATSMLDSACYNMGSIQSGDIHLGGGITFTAANVAGPLESAFRLMTNWTGQVKWGANVLVDEIDPLAQTNAFTNSTNVPGYALMHPYWKGGTL